MSEKDLSGKGEIYMIKNKITGESYIGQTRCMKIIENKQKYSGYERIYGRHMTRAKRDKEKGGCKLLYEGKRKYGRENFEVELLERCELRRMNEKKLKYINEYDTIVNGYNMTQYGTGFPDKNRKMSEENRKKILEINGRDESRKNKSIKMRKNGIELPVNITYVYRKGKLVGYRVQKRIGGQIYTKYFASVDKPMEEKYEMAVQYLNKVNGIDVR